MIAPGKSTVKFILKTIKNKKFNLWLSVNMFINKENNFNFLSQKYYIIKSLRSLLLKKILNYERSGAQ